MRALAPSAMVQLDAVHEVAWTSTDAELLELCRLRIAGMLGDWCGLERRALGAGVIDEATIAALQEWRASDRFTDFQRARLAFTEQFVQSVSAVTDADVAALLVDSDEASVYQFVTAVYVIEMTARVDMAVRALFSGDAT